MPATVSTRREFWAWLVKTEAPWRLRLDGPHIICTARWGRLTFRACRSQHSVEQHIKKYRRWLDQWRREEAVRRFAALFCADSP